MLEKMKEIIADQLGVSEDEVTLEASFKEDLDADSLDLFVQKSIRKQSERYIRKTVVTEPE